MGKYEKMTDEELYEFIEKTYGKDWTPEDLYAADSALFAEYVKRITKGNTTVQGGS